MSKESKYYSYEPLNKAESFDELLLKPTPYTREEFKQIMALPSFEKLPSRFAFLKGIEWIPPLFHYGWPIDHKEIHLYAKKRGLVIKAWKAPPEDEDDPYRPSSAEDVTDADAPGVPDTDIDKSEPANVNKPEPKPDSKPEEDEDEDDIIFTVRHALRTVASECGVRLTGPLTHYVIGNGEKMFLFALCDNLHPTETVPWDRVKAIQEKLGLEGEPGWYFDGSRSNFRWTRREQWRVTYVC